MFLLNMVKSSIEDELESFFETLNGHSPDSLSVTKSAFTQARSKLKHTAFIELNQRLVDEATPVFNKRWKGFRILAVDGSVINLPEKPALRTHFDPEGTHMPQARGSQLLDVLNQITVDARFDPMRIDERSQAIEHLNYAQKGDLILYDRGYPGFYLFAQHQRHAIDFCARCPWNLYNETRDFWLSGKRQQAVTLKPSAKAARQCRQAGLICTTLTVRLVRVDLPSGEPEVLITSVLDESIIPANAFQGLYHLRWGVEEDYKVLKQRLELEQFSGYSVQAVQQDFYAKVVSKNLTALLVQLAQQQVDEKTAHRKRRYKVNMTRALSRMKHQIVKLLIAADLEARLERLVRLIASSYEAIRPDRSFPRKKGRSGKFKRIR